MKWTTKRPSQAGWYFTRQSDGEGGFFFDVVYVYEAEENSWLYTSLAIHEDQEYFADGFEDGELEEDFISWAGLIPEPGE